jgi:hypothetical protein
MLLREAEHSGFSIKSSTSIDFDLDQDSAKNDRYFNALQNIEIDSMRV